MMICGNCEYWQSRECKHPSLNVRTLTEKNNQCDLLLIPSGVLFGKRVQPRMGFRKKVAA
jgi:hypothetical protein